MVDGNPNPVGYFSSRVSKRWYFLVPGCDASSYRELFHLTSDPSVTRMTFGVMDRESRGTLHFGDVGS